MLSRGTAHIMTLTTTQAKILAFLKAHIKSQGYPPTRQEICDHMGYRSANAAQEALQAIERKGMIELRDAKSRGIRVL